ncbi:hypothetical protein AB0C13_21115 [Streptomyces sp. NPDC049099]|uniref:hypothetical protein n=1 Tax=Streptomyces sp. NPDC049099 TaxID=3155768 RepID=UPI00342E270D
MSDERPRDKGEGWYRSRRREFGPWELREAVLSRATELEALLGERIKGHPDSQKVEVLAKQALRELHEARCALNHVRHPRSKTGSHLTVARIHLDTAHNLLLRLSEPGEVIPMMPGVLAFVQEQLEQSDPRRVAVESIAETVEKTRRLTESDLETILDAVGVARQSSIGDALRVRSFVNIVGWVTFVLAAGAAAVAFFGIVHHDTVPLCFTPPQGLGQAQYEVVCPVQTSGPVPASAKISSVLRRTTSPLDYLVVEIVGLVAAGIAAATSLRKIRGASTPYNVPVVLAALKLPTGALTAVLGLQLMRGGFVPGLNALDSSAQIIAWSIVFGYSQQLFTGLVDSQAQALVNSTGASNAPGNPPRAPSPPPGGAVSPDVP